jgi:hypothetical protein
MQKTNRPGRPALDEDGERSTAVGVRLSPKEFDALYQRAARDRLTMSEVVRRDIRRGARQRTVDE